MEQVFSHPEVLFNPNSASALESLETARKAHEKYLMTQLHSDLETAMEHYICAVKLDPMLAESYYRLASLMWEQGQISLNTAIEQCKTAVSLAPRNINAHIYTGYFLKLAEDYKSAENEFRTAINMSKLNSARPRLLLSQSILQKMNIEGASSGDFARFLYYFSSGSLMVMWDLASLKMFYKNMEDDFSVFAYKSVGTLLERLRLVPLTMKIYDKAVKKTCHAALFYEKMGDLCIKCGDVEIGKECYLSSREANPQNRDILVKLATITQTYFPDEIEGAIDYYNSLLEFGENLAPIYYELGHLYIAKNDKVNSISAFRLALEKDSENPFYNNSLAYSYVRAELYEDAIEYYLKAIKLNPDAEWTAIVCQALGAIYAEVNGNFEAALATYQAGIILSPKNHELLIASGDIYMAQNDVDKAIKSYCDAITLAPQDFRAYSKAGLALWEKDYLEESIIAYSKAISLNPQSEIAHNNLGVVYLDGVGAPDEALIHFRAAIDVNPNYTVAYFNMGRALQMQGEGAEAADYYQMALDLNKLTNELDESDILERIYGLFNL